jgi:hypothetical protein
MVKGLDLFREHFAALSEQFVLIGGTAATLAMAEVGLEFRATKDLDIVLHIEALSPNFGTAFWNFVERGDYEIRQASDTGKPVLYRFQKPADSGFPAMLELFCRSPDGLQLAEGAHLTPIPFGEAVASLSAILLDDEYYSFIVDGRRNEDGLPWIGAEQLIPLKARAWLDLNARRAEGHHVDVRDIRKHANDVIRLSQLLASDSRIPIATRIAEDLRGFLGAVAMDGSYDPKAMQIDLKLAQVIDRVRGAYKSDVLSNATLDGVK